MAQTAEPKPRRIDEADTGLDPEIAKKVRTWAIIAIAVLLVAGTWFVWHKVNQGRRVDRWEALSRIERPYEDAISSRSWLQPVTPGFEVDARAEHIRRLEDFLA